MVRTVNNLLFRGSLKDILESIGDIRNTNGEVVCDSHENNHTECG